MVNVSAESPLETEQRLRRVMCEATLMVYDGAYAFHEYGPADFEAHADPAALAIVRDNDSWCQLVPAAAEDSETFLVWRHHFPKGIDNSGFVGWLASRLKAKFGTGVFVICGQNSAAGGIYDYYGAPIELADGVRAELMALTGSGDRFESDSPNLDGVIMQVTHTSPSSVIDQQTVFHFTQTGKVVHARYAGGSIVAASLDGTLEDGVLSFAFSQIEAPDTLATGTSRCRLRVRDGALELVEDFTWSDDDRPPGQNIMRQI